MCVTGQRKELWMEEEKAEIAGGENPIQTV